MGRPAVLHVITALGLGGAEQTLVRLLRAQRGEADASVLSLRDRGVFGGELERLGISLDTLGIMGSAPSFGAVRRLWDLGKRPCPAIVQGWMYHGNLGATVIALRRRSRPLLWNIRQSLSELADEKPGTVWVIRALRLLSRQPLRIIYNSRTSAAQHEALGFSSRRRLVIPNGIDTAEYRPNPEARRAVRRRLSIPEEAVLVGAIGRDHPMKDHDGFLRAAAVVAGRNPQVQFVMAGTGVNQGNRLLSERARSLGITHRVHLIGEVHDVPALMAALDILCSPSARGEGFPNVVAEAMATGVASIGTDVGDTAALIGRAGLVVPPSDPAALAAAIGRLADVGSEHRSALGEVGRQRIQQHYRVAHMAQAYGDLYAEVREEMAGSR